MGNFQGFRIRKLIFHEFICFEQKFAEIPTQGLHFQRLTWKEINITELKRKAQLILLPADTTFTQVKHTCWLCLHSHTPTDHNRRSNSSGRKQVALSARAPPSETAGGGTPQRERWRAGWPSPPCDSGSWPCAAPASPQRCTPPATQKHLSHLLHFNILSAALDQLKQTLSVANTCSKLWLLPF